MNWRESGRWIRGFRERAFGVGLQTRQHQFAGQCAERGGEISRFCTRVVQNWWGSDPVCFLPSVSAGGVGDLGPPNPSAFFLAAMPRIEVLFHKALGRFVSLW
jgi:hypothetical protein